MTNKILSLIRNKTQSVDELMKAVAGNVRAMRLGRNITQKDFALRLGIALPTYRRFEQSGEISLRKLVEIAQFLDCTQDLEKLFSSQEYASIEDVINGTQNRKRAGKNEE